LGFFFHYVWSLLTSGFKSNITLTTISKGVENKTDSVSVMLKIHVELSFLIPRVVPHLKNI